LPGSDGSDEDVLTHAMFPQVAPKFFASRSQGPKNLGKDPAANAPAASGSAAAPASTGGAAPVRVPVAYDVTVNGRSHRITVAPVG
ncbi:MAG: oxaloacetate decarboxylase, partial [Proteobacteria bacterium]|nr:oxaloacetate decarboxylase [Pseudomonadota bacterium]